MILLWLTLVAQAIVPTFVPKSLARGCDLTKKITINFYDVLSNQPLYQDMGNEWSHTHYLSRLKSIQSTQQFLASSIMLESLTHTARNQLLFALSEGTAVATADEFRQIAFGMISKISESLRLEIDLIRTPVFQNQTELALFLENRGLGPNFVINIIEFLWVRSNQFPTETLPRFTAEMKTALVQLRTLAFSYAQKLKRAAGADAGIKNVINQEMGRYLGVNFFINQSWGKQESIDHYLFRRYNSSAVRSSPLVATEILKLDSAQADNAVFITIFNPTKQGLQATPWREKTIAIEWPTTPNEMIVNVTTNEGWVIHHRLSLEFAERLIDAAPSINPNDTAIPNQIQIITSERWIEMDLVSGKLL